MGIIPGCLGESSVLWPAGESGKNLNRQSKPHHYLPSLLARHLDGILVALWICIITCQTLLLASQFEGILVVLHNYLPDNLTGFLLCCVFGVLGCAYEHEFKAEVDTGMGGFGDEARNISLYQQGG
jgi:hypothetical protein